VNILPSVITVITSVGLASTIGGFIYIGRKLQKLDTLEITVEKIKINLKVVTDFLTKDNKNFNPAELQTYSPRRLAPEGDRFIVDHGFDAIFAAHKADFFRCIEDEDPKLKYDVETAAIRSISVLSDNDYMSFLKILFYNDPNRNMQNTAPTLGVYIRDKYLAEHPEITK
jgi:hypothetical protein